MIGGKRAGAGRKRAVEGELLTTVAFGLAQRHVQAIKQWQLAHECSSASEAVRQMIDLAGGSIELRPMPENLLVEATDEEVDAAIEIVALLHKPTPPPAGGESSQDWQWKRQPISKAQQGIKPKQPEPNRKSKGD